MSENLTDADTFDATIQMPTSGETISAADLRDKAIQKLANRTNYNTNRLARVDVQAFSTPGSDTWTKPSWATATTPVRAFIVPGGGGGGGGGVSTSAGGGGGNIPIIADFLAGSLAATETVTIGAAGTAGFTTAGGDGGVSEFATGKAYASTAIAATGGAISAGDGGSGGCGGGSGSAGGTGNGGDGGTGGGPGYAADSGTPGTVGAGVYVRGGGIGACGLAGSGGAAEGGGSGGVGWGAGGGGGAAQSAGLTGAGGGGAGWTGYTGYPTAGSGDDRTGSSTNGGVGCQGIVVVVTGATTISW